MTAGFGLLAACDFPSAPVTLAGYSGGEFPHLNTVLGVQLSRPGQSRSLTAHAGSERRSGSSTGPSGPVETCSSMGIQSITVG